MKIEHHSVDIVLFYTLFPSLFAARTELLPLHAHSVP